MTRLWELGPCPMGTLDERGRLGHANRSLCELLGQPLEALRGTSPAQRLVDAAGWTHAWQQLAASPDGTVRAPLRVGAEIRRITLVACEPNDNGIHALLFVSELPDDVAAREAADREHRLLEDRIRESQRLESLAVLAGGIAHDFNNLLVGVLGNADAAMTALPPDSRAREAIGHVSQAALRAADLARQMLAYAGQGRFTIEPIDLSHLVQEMVHLLRTVVPRNVELRLELAPDLPATEGDVTQLRQVVMNLITNAADACAERGGTISIRTGAAERDAEWLRRTYGAELQPGYYLTLEVADDGVGMDDATRRHIFDPFFTTKDTGRGLGLAAALGIVRSLRGAIRVQSQPGRGTRFRVLLPARPRLHRRTSGPLPAHDTDRSWRGSGTVLLVDDEPLVQRASARMLQSLGFSVATVGDGLEALEWLGEHPDEATVVLLDMSMPGLSGPATFERMRTIAPELPVVLSSGRESEEVLEHLTRLGLAGFLPKPYRLSELRDTLRQVLGDDAGEERAATDGGAPRSS